MKKSILLMCFMLAFSVVNVRSQDVSGNVTKDADDFIKRYGYDQDYSEFYIRTSASFDYGLCYYDPCDFYDEEQGVSYDYLTTIKFDPGTGLDYDLFGGYHINRFISVGLGLNYFHGLNMNQERTGGGEGSTYSEQRKLTSSIFSIDPGIEISPGFSKINPFIDFNLMIGIIPRIMEKETNTTYSGTTTNEIFQSGVYHGGIPIGYDIKGGVDFKLSKLIDIYADLNFKGFNYTPTKYSMKEYTVNGVDEFSTLTTKQKETVFVKNYDSKETIPADSPNKQLKESFPFTSLGIDVGVKFNLGSWKRF
jgi:hypothetical protein